MSGIWVLKGNLCPNGAVMKPSAASQSLFHHRGRAVVFESIEDLHARIDDPGLEVDARFVLVLKGCGPKGYPGMPEVGNMPLPRKLLEQGVSDMLRISDARMSGTAFGTVVLHVAPEAAAGGPLAMVRDGDEILFDGPNRRLELLISPDELAARAAAWKQQPPAAEIFARLLPALRSARHAGRSGLRPGFPDRSERERRRPGIALMARRDFIVGDWGTSHLRLFLCDGPRHDPRYRRRTWRCRRQPPFDDLVRID